MRVSACRLHQLDVLLFHDQIMDIHSIQERKDIFSFKERKTRNARRVLRWLPPLSFATASFLGLFNSLSYTSSCIATQYK
jgi:hypothetical protein